MEGLTIKSDLSINLVNNYIEYIDRTEKTTRSYITNIRQFIAWLSYEGITRPTTQDIKAYKNYLLSEHKAIKLDHNGWIYRTDRNGNHIIIKCKANTVKAYLQSVKQFFTWLSLNGYYPNVAQNVHIPNVKQDNHKKEALTCEDVRTIQESILKQGQSKATAIYKKDTFGRSKRATEQTARLYAMFLLSVNLGLRTIELHRANIKDIETKNGVSYLYIWGKGHAEADTRKTIAEPIKEALDHYLKLRTDNYNGNSPLFVATGNRSKGKRLATTTISTMLKRAMQEAGFNSEKITAHSLRHTAGTNIQELTNDLYLTQQYMRHENPTTTEIYLHNSADKQETDLANRLYNFYQGKEADDREELIHIIESMNTQSIHQLKEVAQMLK